MRALALVLLLLAAGALEARTVGDRAVSRNEAARALYDAGRYEEALQAYKEALVERPESARLHLNVGDALFQLGDYEGALREFERVAEAEDPVLSASGHYNKGNAHFELQDYGAAVEAYRQTLERTPGDTDAKANLELALQRLPPPPPPQPQRSGTRTRRIPRRRRDSQQQQPSSPEPGEEQPEADEGSEAAPEAGEGTEQESPPGTPDASDPPPPTEESGMEREEAERLLDALRDREKDAQERRYRARGRGDEALDW